MLYFGLAFEDEDNKNKENKKYRPPSHCEVDLHINKVSSNSFILLNIVKPVEENPDIDSK